jgi:hypothetical protein
VADAIGTTHHNIFFTPQEVTIHATTAATLLLAGTCKYYYPKLAS